MSYNYIHHMDSAYRSHPAACVQNHMHHRVLPPHNQAITHFHHAFRQIHPMLSSHNMEARLPSHDRFYPRVPVSTQLRYSSTRKHDTAKSKLPVVSGFVHDYHNLKYPVHVPVSDCLSDVLPVLYPFYQTYIQMDTLADAPAHMLPVPQSKDSHEMLHP